MIPKIAAVTCLHKSAQLTAMPGRGLPLDKSASAALRGGENSEVAPGAATTATQHFEHDPDTCRSRPHQLRCCKGQREGVGCNVGRAPSGDTGPVCLRSEERRVG